MIGKRRHRFYSSQGPCEHKVGANSKFLRTWVIVGHRGSWTQLRRTDYITSVNSMSISCRLERWNVEADLFIFLINAFATEILTLLCYMEYLYIDIRLSKPRVCQCPRRLAIDEAISKLAAQRNYVLMMIAV